MSHNTATLSELDSPLTFRFDLANHHCHALGLLLVPAFMASLVWNSATKTPPQTPYTAH